MLTPLRPPAYVMRLERMGCFHQTRLSFMRALLRKLKINGWRFNCERWDVDAKGVGVAIYSAQNTSRVYSLICFANDLPPEKRSDRVIAEEWDAAFTLFDGVPAESDIERLRENVPKQEAGHCTQSELVLARANRSVRLFAHVVECLANGCQPDQKMIDDVGYLMRTTAVYGNGKFGVSDRDRIADRAEFKSAFHAELLAVWLIRGFTIDIVEHMAGVRAREIGKGEAIKMNLDLRRRLGVGNSTGLGMAPFLVLHPGLIHSWINARETALARIRALSSTTQEIKGKFDELISRMSQGVASWNTTDKRQQIRIKEITEDLHKLSGYLQKTKLSMEFPWGDLVNWSQNSLTIETQELLVSLIIEPHGELVDDLADTMAIDEAQFFPIHGTRTVSELKTAIEENYRWALDINFSETNECARFWYYSEEKLEPRIGERFDEPGAEKEHPLAFGRDVSVLYQDMEKLNGIDNKSIAEFLLEHPHHRHAVRRIQIATKLEYAEIRDNLISHDMMPVDLLRCKLSFFGANKFDPKSDRWVRINMYQHAPYPDEFDAMEADDWIYPPL